MEKINVAEILRTCPTGMALDCTMFDDVYFDSIDDVSDIIKCYIQDSRNKIGLSFSKYGHYSNLNKTKCVIFPKGKTTWDGFVSPRKFEDGDICYVNFDNYYENIFIFKEIYEHNYISGYVNLHCNSLLIDGGTVCTLDGRKEIRPATEAEKEKLFKAIKENGYKWDPTTKTLEKLVEPKFKVGDIVKSKNCHEAGNFSIVGVEEDRYLINIKNYCIEFKDQDNYELVSNKFDINTLIPFESRVLVRNENDRTWRPAVYGGYIKNHHDSFYVLGGNSWRQCIPYEGNEHLRCTTDNCDEHYKNW